MKRDPVRINNDRIITFVRNALIERLHEFQCLVAIASFDGVHAHVLVQCRRHDPRVKLGIAKQYATAQLKAHGSAMGLHELNLDAGAGIWGVRSHPTPITCERHLDKTFDYIERHAMKGAVVIVPEWANLLEDFDPNDLLIA